jgi:hypothetical protein
MSSHTLRVVTHYGNLRLVCSCGCEPLQYGLIGTSWTLDMLNEIAHEHIEAAERGARYRSAPRTSLIDESQGGDFTYG